MVTTSPDNLYSPNISGHYALPQDLAAMMTSVQNALNRRANSYSGTKLERLAFTPPENGIHWQDTDGDSFEYEWRNGRWYPIPRTLSGKVNIVPSGNNVPTSVTVNFPPGYFTQAPDVTVSPGTTVPGTTVLGTSIGTVTSSSVVLWGTRTNTTGYALYWVAVQTPED